MRRATRRPRSSGTIIVGARRRPRPLRRRRRTTTTCAPIPEETAGPYPGDGSNGPDVLAESGIVRSDIRSSIGDASGVAEGVPLTVDLTVTDTAAGCVPLAGAAVYIWHCDREGRYSMYSEGAENENYLRGVQETDGDGRVTFTSIFPACYSGRWPHIHFEVYASVEDATGGGEPIATSQLAFPQDVCETRLRDRRLRPERHQPRPGVAGVGHGVRRRHRPAAGRDGRNGGSGYTATLATPV